MTVIHKCMLSLFMSKNQVMAILRKAPARTMAHNGPARPPCTLCNRLPRNSATVLKPRTERQTILIGDNPSPLLGPGNVDHLANVPAQICLKFCPIRLREATDVSV
jgi:hypothetical protein